MDRLNHCAPHFTIGADVSRHFPVADHAMPLVEDDYGKDFSLEALEFEA
jgi:hypothetical protein